MLDSGIISKIKQASMTLAKMYMKRVTMELESNWNTDRESSQDSLLLQGVHFEYRDYQFAGGLDSETLRFRRDKATRAGTPCSRVSRTFGWHTNGNHHEKPLIFFYYALLDSWLSPPKAGILTFITIILFCFPPYLSPSNGPKIEEITKMEKHHHIHITIMHEMRLIFMKREWLICYQNGYKLAASKINMLQYRNRILIVQCY
ncbi:hypothetical protein HN51_046896 [Arachis hypogaea]|uniref:uncharacterized protein LOC107624889 n=1 Tax=Arachis ipaensis TaxID=130454 RepID=UPI0007AF21C9|nr:uncharacterized protein LOC107624889 [Arachis ipaensis]XP_020971193.1 uncharacterized protein LOC107624889 [Arachis ipaensis]QHO23119.1 Protein CHUP1 [Arachis hypogaea]